MIFFIAITAVSIVIAFIIWQFKVMMKYAFKFDRITIDEKRKYLTLNKEKIFFKDIDHIDINELEQPALYEKALSKGAVGHYMSEIILYLKNGTHKKCIFNYKGILYKTLKRLQPYTIINFDIENYKQESLPDWLSVVLLVAGCILILKFLS